MQCLQSVIKWSTKKQGMSIRNSCVLWLEKLMSVKANTFACVCPLHTYKLFMYYACVCMYICRYVWISFLYENIIAFISWCMCVLELKDIYMNRSLESQKIFPPYDVTIHLFYKHLSSSYHVPGNFLKTKDTHRGDFFHPFPHSHLNILDPQTPL